MHFDVNGKMFVVWSMKKWEWFGPFAHGRIRNPMKTSLPRSIDIRTKPAFKRVRTLSPGRMKAVYQAVDLTASPARLCVLKKGGKRTSGSWPRRTGSQRVQKEAQVLSELFRKGVEVPEVYFSFQSDGCSYVVVEFIEGVNLQEWLRPRKRRLSVRTGLRISLQIAQIMMKIHRAGWVWRDCKPRNIMVTNIDTLRAIDFEGACRVSQPDPFAFGTQFYLAPESTDPFRGQSRVPEDLYALGTVFYLLFAGCTPGEADSAPIEHMRRNLPIELVKVVSELLALQPNKRPTAKAVVRRLKSLLIQLN